MTPYIYKMEKNKEVEREERTHENGRVYGKACHLCHVCHSMIAAAYFLTVGLFYVFGWILLIVGVLGTSAALMFVLNGEQPNEWVFPIVLVLAGLAVVKSASLR